FLSGGIDSSCIAYYAHKHLNCSSQTFSVVYRDPSFDESRYSTLVARHLQTRHHELLLKIEDAKETINHLDEFMDEPLSDMSLIPTYLLSRLTRQFVTVALGGDGADELFLGYPTHTAHLLTRSYNRLPGFIRQNGIQPLVKRLPASHKDFSLDFQLKRFVSSANLSPLLRHFSWQAHIPFEQREELYHQPFDSTGNLMGFLNPRLPRNIDSVPRLIEYLDLKFYLPNDILAKVDTASMANSLEVRSPFLDADVVRFVYSLPVNLKYRLFRQKFLLKKLAEKFLPRKVVYRKKHGFGIPIGRWLKEDLYGHAEGLLSKKRLENIPQLQFGFVRKLLDQHRSGHQNHRKSIWSLMVLSSWLQSYYHV
ncbi:MAG: asparagine synthetase B family protein, partial [Nitrospinales bacterium]